jgi:Alpha/beta hydrolase domain
MTMFNSSRLLVAVAASAAVLASGAAEARIIRIEIQRTEPAFGGRIFGATGAYERLIGKAYGEVDPRLPANAIIQDIDLAPRNAKGMVEYATDIDILRPADRSKGNGILFFNIHNRGNKGGIQLFNADVPSNLAEINSLANPGDGFLQRQGYTMIWFGWQADVLAGNNRMTMAVPVAHNPDGSTITGLVRSELTTVVPTTTLNLSSGWFTALTTASYPTVSTANKTPLADGFVPTLTVRAKEQEPRVSIPNTEWSFGACPQGSNLAVSDTQICYPAGFKPGRLYELIYRAKDPVVLGLGFAAARDLGAFLKAEPKDDNGRDNPVFVKDAKTIMMGSSQSGRFVRTLIHLGFNRDERGQIVFDGAFPHIGGGLMPLNVRFGQPGRAAGTEQVDRLYPGASFPFAYGTETDPLSGAKGGILDRCTATNTCPKIVHAATALEMWELRQSLGFTDPLGIRDLIEPPNVRSYIMASTQHTAAALPLAAKEPFGFCQQQPNPNPHTWTVRALLQNLAAWIKDGTEPPPSARPTIAAGTLVAPDQVHFPSIPANKYGGVSRPVVHFLRVHNPLHPHDYGEDFRSEQASGMISVDPPKVSQPQYGTLVAQVDTDGNDLDGIRNVFVQVPIGTYTGWNLFNRSFYEDGVCTLQGSFIPFARTKAERTETSDPRLSIEERYPSRETYVAAIRKAGDDLVSKRYLLAEDAARLLAEAERDGIRAAP